VAVVSAAHAKMDLDKIRYPAKRHERLSTRASARTVSTRTSADACEPGTRTDAALAALFVAQTEYRAVTIPWTKARATSAPAGLLARGSRLDARLPRPRMT